MNIEAVAPATDADAITPNDSTVITPTRGVYVGVSGDLKVTLIDGSAVTFVGIAAGVVHPLQVVVIWSTGTDATDIIALR